MKRMSEDMCPSVYTNFPIDNTVDAHDTSEKDYTQIDDGGMHEVIPKEEVKAFVSRIQKIKDDHNEKGAPINYGTICGILIDGYKLLKENTEPDSRESKLEPELKAVSPNVPPKFANKTEVLAKGFDEWYQEVYECRYCGKHFMVDRDAKGHPYLNCCPCCGNYVRDIVREQK